MKKIITLSLVALALFSCQKNEPEDLFGKSASERFEEKQNELRAALTAAEQGWKLTYFTKEGTFGGFTFLMKFDPNGLVQMTSDIETSATPTTSKYEIQEGQGTMLTFTTKNYLHKLSDSYSEGIRGLGYLGEFQFVYYGKEGDKLKFKTQRSGTEQFVYFEKATADEWAHIQSVTERFFNVKNNAIKYYMKVTDASGNVKEYDFIIDSYRNVTIGNISNQQIAAHTGVVPTETGLTFYPPIVLEGKTFKTFSKEGVVSPTIYKGTSEGVTAEVLYESTPTASHLTAADQEIAAGKIRGLVNIGEFIKPTPFYNQPIQERLCRIDAEKSFTAIRIVFISNTKVSVQIGYYFPEKEDIEYLYFNFDYTIVDKKIYLQARGIFPGATDINVWVMPKYRDVFRAAQQRIVDIKNIFFNGGVYIRKTSWRYYMLPNNPIYVLQRANFPDEYLAFFGVMAN